MRVEQFYNSPDLRPDFCLNFCSYSLWVWIGHIAATFADKQTPYHE